MSRPSAATILHASAVALNDRGLLILGASGAGKSGLALRMIALGANLVADDQVVLRRLGSELRASSPAPLAGLIEARGLGLVRTPPAPEARIVLAVDLDRSPEARMPQRMTFTVSGVPIRLIFGRGLPNLDSVLTIFLKNGLAEIE